MVLEHWLGFLEEMEWQLHTHPTKAILLQLKKNTHFVKSSTKKGKEINFLGA